ncbi:TLP-20 [Alphabaculovirus myunipunctae]|uniref:TLP-20 n=1 Tax=Mythimna unipuncta nucleopolyhedrovirus TaxID=447897 RepID=A0A2K9VSC2_9ABAC|nr:TLP-20 [Mythimna unipuncta nucleopolyhedrovirus]AUV65357.1 TLP-20 [Mythimna unipuncta nucleopolyhedrovirus]
MATNNSNTVDISVHVTLDKEANKNILSFIVREEYHLKKLAVGAYSLNILHTQLLNDLAQRSCTVTACGDYVVVYNFVENTSNKLNVILFNIKPTVLKKGACIFKIAYCNAAMSAATKTKTTTTTTSAAVISDKILDEKVENLKVQHANSQLFKSTFARKSDDDSSSSSSSDDDDDTAGVAAPNNNDDDDDDDGAANDISEPVPVKRQKIDESVESKV